MLKVFLSATALTVVSVASAQLWTSGFETQDFSEWDGLATGESEVQTIDSSTANSGTFSALSPGTNVDGGSGLNSYVKSVGPIASGDVSVLTFWMKLNTASGANRHYTEFRSYSGDAYGSGSLEQLVAIGAYNAATNIIDGSGNITTGSNTNKWQARIAFGGFANGGWFQLDQAADRTTEWTRFDIIATPTTFQFLVNGTNGMAVDLLRTGDYSFDSVVMGSRLTSTGGLTANFDDFSVDAVPEPATMAILGGLAAVALRRKRNSA